MKFGLFTEGDTHRGYSVTQRYDEMIREAQFAEEVGFDTWGCSEQHFVGPSCTTSAPEVIYGAVAHATSRITLRTMSTVMLHFNHPIRIAERLATIDVLSHGRLEIAAVRGNNAHVFDAFQVDAANTVKEWDETFRVVVKAGRVPGSGVRSGHRDGSGIVGVTTLRRLRGDHHDDQDQHAAGRAV